MDFRADVGQVHQIAFVHLDQAQALRGIGIQTGLDQRGLARAPRPGQEHVVGWQALDELFGVAADLVLLVVDLLEIGQLNRGHLAHRLERTMPPAAFAVPKRHRGIPIGRTQGLRQDGLDAIDQGLGPVEQALERIVHAVRFLCRPAQER